MTATATATAAPSAADAVRTGSLELARLLGQLERPDLVGRVTAAAARLQRPSTIVAVVGEFKQGKSSLVNGLLGQPVCPVDDDLATSAITLVRYGEQPGAVVRRNGSDGDKGGPIPIDDAARLGLRARQPRQPQGRRAGRDHGAERDPRPGTRPRRHARHGWARRRPRRRHARLPPVRRRSDPRVRRLVGALRPGGRLPATRCRAVPDGDVRPDEDRPVPGVGADRRPQPRSPRAGRGAHPDRRRVEPPAIGRARPQGPLAQRGQPVPRADHASRQRGRDPGQGERRGSLGPRRPRRRATRPLRAGAGAPTARRPVRRRRCGGRHRAGQRPHRAPAWSWRPLVGARQRPHRRPHHERHPRPAQRDARHLARHGRARRGPEEGRRVGRGDPPPADRVADEVTARLRRRRAGRPLDPRRSGRAAGGGAARSRRAAERPPGGASTSLDCGRRSRSTATSEVSRRISRPASPGPAARRAA